LDEKEQVKDTEHIRRYKLACAIESAEDIELESKDIAYFREKLAKRYTPLVVGQAILLLEPDAKSE
jgi:hypothetical protein